MIGFLKEETNIKLFYDSITLLNSFSEEDKKMLQYVFQDELPKQ